MADSQVVASSFSVTDPLQNAFTTLLNYVPRLIGALVVLVIGYFVARIVAKVITKVLQKAQFDHTMERANLQQFLDRSGTSMTPSTLLGKVVFWFIFVMSFTMFASALGVPQISGFLNSVLGYIPNIFAALVILCLAALFANFLAGVVRAATGSELLAKLTRGVILVYAAFVALTQLHIAQQLTGPTFLIILGAVALAAALAFGLGGRDQAQQLLERFVNSQQAPRGNHEVREHSTA